MIWFASITINLGPTFLSGALAASAGSYGSYGSDPTCPLVRGPYRHYILNALWIGVNAVCVGLTLFHLKKLHRDLTKVSLDLSLTGLLAWLDLVETWVGLRRFTYLLEIECYLSILRDIFVFFWDRFLNLPVGNAFRPVLHRIVLSCELFCLQHCENNVKLLNHKIETKKWNWIKKFLRTGLSNASKSNEKLSSIRSLVLKPKAKNQTPKYRWCHVAPINLFLFFFGLKSFDYFPSAKQALPTYVRVGKLWNRQKSLVCETEFSQLFITPMHHFQERITFTT